MKIVFSLLICFCFNYCYSQQVSNKFLLKEGCYVRGYYSGNPNNTLFWYIKNDSTFINFYINQNNIRMIRKGEWHYLGDSMLSLQYHPLQSTVLVNSRIDYHAETKASTDSVYFYGSVKGNDGKPLAFSTLVFDNAKKEYARFGVGYGLRGVTTDANGNFGFSIHKIHYFGSLGIAFTPDNYPLTINTFPNNNYHTLNITVPLKDSTNDVDITKFDDRTEVYKYHALKEQKKLQYKEHELAISYISKDTIFLLNILYEARKRQPYLAGPIYELIEFLKKE